jgi:hypothetical protein
VQEENTQVPADEEPEPTETNVPHEQAPETATEDLQASDIQSLEESALLESDAEPEFEIVSADEAPLEFAEEYPQFQVIPDSLLY